MAWIALVVATGVSAIAAYPLAIFVGTRVGLTARDASVVATVAVAAAAVNQAIRMP